MKRIIFFIPVIFICLLISCNNADLEQEVADKKSEIDSLKKALAEQKELLAKDTITTPVEEEPEAQPNLDNIKGASEGRLAGEHNLTIQWISWEKPGSITFKTIGANKYQVEGTQKGEASGECANCYLTVKGVIEEIDPKRLRFTGKIESSIYHIQGGAPCIKEGTFDFVSTKNRKYWRCRNMKGCEGVTDYVDIYF